MQSACILQTIKLFLKMLRHPTSNTNLKELAWTFQGYGNFEGISWDFQKIKLLKEVVDTSCEHFTCRPRVEVLWSSGRRTEETAQSVPKLVFCLFVLFLVGVVVRGARSFPTLFVSSCSWPPGLVPLPLFPWRPGGHNLFIQAHSTAVMGCCACCS